MFETCNTIAELNAARVQASATNDLVEVNNAYNKRRQEIINSRPSFVRCKKLTGKPRPVQRCCYIPVIGRSDTPNTIVLTEKGFTY